MDRLHWKFITDILIYAAENSPAKQRHLYFDLGTGSDVSLAWREQF